MNPFRHSSLPRGQTALILCVAALVGVGLGLVAGQPEKVQAIAVAEAENPASEVQLQTRNVPMFNGVSFTRKEGSTTAVQVMILAGDEQSVGVVAKQGQHQAVQTQVIDGILYIQVDRDFADSGPLRIKVGSPRIKSIRMDGISSVSVNGGLRTESLKIEASRGAEITARRLGGRQVSVAARMGGRVLVGGRVRLLKAHASSGVIDAHDLATEVAEVSSVERSRVEVNVEERLEAYARDRASILYANAPRRLLRDLDHSSRLQML